jgi:DNA-binding MarR family transcriptional regulator/N-acetylglutamate synthase-like GNAT family acetyltransferase
MSNAAVDRVRSFNRLVTQRVGALNDQYLARDRPLGEARLLWEIGRDGRDVRRLRARLDLDSGYLSRLLRSLEAAGLVRVEPSEEDKRVRTARLTPAGVTEWELLDQRSDELAQSFLEPLGPSQRARLVAAMAEVELLLTATLVELREVDPGAADAQFCLGEYFAELGRRFDSGFDPASDTTAQLHELRPPAGVFLVASLRSEPIACGGLKLHGDEPAELKRMWVAESARGMGLGRRLLGELERRAAAAGATAVRLETNRNLTEAIALYRSAGYIEVDAFNDLVYAHHWFEKRLPRPPKSARRRRSPT